MGCQIRMTILLIESLIFAVDRESAIIESVFHAVGILIPFVQAHRILYQQKSFVGKERWAKGGGEIQRLDEHYIISWLCHSEQSISQNDIAEGNLILMLSNEVT